MTSPNTLERMARAICGAINTDVPQGTVLMDRYWPYYVPHAKAALQALKTIDDSTVEAMASEAGWKGLNRTWDTGTQAARAFKAIVTEILNQGAEG